MPALLEELEEATSLSFLDFLTLAEWLVLGMAMGLEVGAKDRLLVALPLLWLLLSTGSGLIPKGDRGCGLALDWGLMDSSCWYGYEGADA